MVNCYSSTYALSCKDGFYPNNGTCTACVANGKKCEFGELT